MTDLNDRSRSQCRERHPSACRPTPSGPAPDRHAITARRRVAVGAALIAVAIAPTWQDRALAVAALAAIWAVLR